MNTTLFICDRCQHEHRSKHRPPRWSRLTVRKLGGFDLCQDCTHELLRFLKQETEEPAPE